MKVIVSMEWSRNADYVFSIFISCRHFDEGMGAILTISVDGHPKNGSVKLYEIEQLAYEGVSFTDFFYFNLWWPFCSADQYHISKGSPKKHSCEITQKSGHWSTRICHLKVFFYFYLWWPFSSRQNNHFHNFGRGSPKEHFCEIILKWSH